MEIATTEKKKPFSLSQVVKDLELKIEIQSFNQLLNTDPPKAWVKQHPFDMKVSYISIDRIKINLFQIFQGYEWSIKSASIIANSIMVYGTLTVTHPITGDKWSVDGIGAVPLELEKGADAIDFTKIKSKAVHKNAPAAESFALKNAAAKYGILFGSGLNSTEDLMFRDIYKDPEDWPLDGFKLKIEQLIRTSTYDHDTQEIMFSKCWGDLTMAEAKTMYYDLLQNQLSPIDRGNMSASEISKHISTK
jgi:hypothetical protein